MITEHAEKEVLVVSGHLHGYFHHYSSHHQKREIFLWEILSKVQLLHREFKITFYIKINRYFVVCLDSLTQHHVSRHLENVLTL